MQDLVIDSYTRGERYRFLSIFFSQEPVVEYIDRLSAEAENLKQLFKTQDSKLDEQIDGLVAELLKVFSSEDKNHEVEKLYLDYIRLFVGPDGPYAPPWESVYTSEEGLLFQESTLQVREQYAQLGLEYVLKGSEPDDHIAAELQFMAHLSDQVKTAESDAGIIRRSLERQRLFLEAHLSKWVGRFCDEMEKNAQSEIFRKLQLLLRAFVSIDHQQIEKSLASMNQ
jgi:TorA maturation chaperone TorD